MVVRCSRKLTTCTILSLLDCGCMYRGAPGCPAMERPRHPGADAWSQSVSTTVHGLTWQISIILDMNDIGVYCYFRFDSWVCYSYQEMLVLFHCKGFLCVILSILACNWSHIIQDFNKYNLFVFFFCICIRNMRFSNLIPFFF